MKRFLNILEIVLALSIIATSCEKEKAPFLTLSTPKTIHFTDQGGTQSITFTANRDWSVSSADSWCKVSPSSGNKAEGSITVTLTCEPNTTYDPRSATLTVRVEELSETITVTQDTNLGLLVSPTSYDLTNAAQSIEVEVRANVKYTVEIDAACKDWITQSSTKALSAEKITFSIAANESYDNREGIITIKQTDGILSETIVVKQGQTNGLFITTPEYEVSNEAHSISVEVKANVEFEVTSQSDWITYIETKALKPSTISLAVLANESYDNRTGTVIVKQKNGDLTGTITILQKQTDGIIVSPTLFELTNAEQSIEIVVKNNVDYSVVVPDDAKEWISIKSNTSTKALADNKVTLAILQNDTYDNREASITIKQVDGPLAETVRIKQSQTNGLFITTPEYDLSNEEHTLSVEVKANVSFQVSPQVDWIKYVETKALTSSTIVLSIEANATYDDRTGTVLVKQTNGDLSGTITINQKQTDGLFVTPTDIDVDNAEHTVELEVKNNVSYDVVIPDDAKEWISIKSNTATKALAENKVTLAIAQNTTYDNREASITIKQTDGSLAETVKIKQAQTDGLIVGKKEYEVGRDGETIEIQLQTNVEYDVIIPEDAKEWVTRVESAPTKALVNESVYLQIGENPTYYNREASVVIKKKDAALQETVSIKQAQTDALFITDESKEYKVPSKGGEIIVNVFHNIDFEIDATSFPEWITISKTDVDTYNTKLSLKVSQNTEYVGRDAEVKILGGTLSDVANVSQHQVDILKTDISEFSASWRETEMTVVIHKNVDYTVTLPSWIKEKSKDTAKDGNLTVETIVYLISENLDEDRSESISYSWENEGVACMTIVTIKQQHCIVALSEAGSLKDLITSQQINSVRVFEILGPINGTDVVLMRRMNNLNKLILKDASIVAGGQNYYANISTKDNEITANMFRSMGIQSIVLPTTITVIGAEAFQSCQNLSEVTIFEGVKEINYAAFEHCSSLASIILPKSLEVIVQYAFNCCALTSITIPENVNTIQNCVFTYCPLTEVHIKGRPNVLTNIWNSAFQGCYETATLFIPVGTRDDYYLTELGNFKTIVEE